MNMDTSASETPIDKRTAKDDKAARKAAKEAEARQKQLENEKFMARIATNVEDESFGYLVPLTSGSPTNSRRSWTSVKAIDSSLVGSQVWVRGRLHDSRCKGSLGFLVLREKFSTVQGVLAASSKEGAKEIIKWAAGVPLESVVDVFAKVVEPAVPVEATTQKVELAIEKLFVVSKAANELPFQMKDANRRDDDDSADAVRVNQETRLDNRILDLRTLANQAIFSVSSQVCTLFREFLLKNEFCEIHSPKLIGGTSEGGSNVFKLKYFSNDACLAQSPQLHKQMAICGDMMRVFEIGPVFRAENSNTHRHLCEFTGLDLEMVIMDNYEEVLDMIDSMFGYIFEGIETRCARELDAIYRQHPNRSFKWIKQGCPRIDFEEGIQMLRESGTVTGIPDCIDTFDLNTEQEKALGRLVFDKYGTDFYILKQFPLGVRPFYTMPSPLNPKLSNSYDIYMRGEEIVSGAQRVHDPEMLASRATACGIPLETISAYVDSFKLGAFPHGGCGVGLERVVMLFLGLGNIRKSSLFPRDPKRLSP